MSILQEHLEEYNPIDHFIYGLASPESRRQYPRRFKVFLDFLGLEGSLNEQAKSFWSKAKHHSKWAEEKLMQFINFQKKRVESGEISPSTVPNYYKATKLFCDMNEIVLNWKKIAKGLPRGREAANDRAPTEEEIQKLMDYPDRRIKPIVTIMVSSGIRIGAFDYLKWKHILPITGEKGEILAAKIIVYGGDNDEYYSFITPEAYMAVKDWMEFRSSYGEKISGESWVMRDIWQTTNIVYGANLGLATFPRKLQSSGIRRIIERGLWEQGLRKQLVNGARRHEWKAAHGFRKFYKTRTEQIMKPINVEITMGHNIGVSASYYKPTEKEVLNDYLKAVDALTVSYNKKRIEQQLEKIKQESKQNNYITRGRLIEKETEISVIKEQNELNTEAITNLADRFTELAEQFAMMKKGRRKN